MGTRGEGRRHCRHKCVVPPRCEAPVLTIFAAFWSEETRSKQRGHSLDPEIKIRERFGQMSSRNSPSPQCLTNFPTLENCVHDSSHKFLITRISLGSSRNCISKLSYKDIYKELGDEDWCVGKMRKRAFQRINSRLSTLYRYFCTIISKCNLLNYLGRPL